MFVLDRSLNMRDEHPFVGPEHRERLEALCAPPDGERIPWRTLKTKQQLAIAHLKHAVDGLPKGTSVEVVHFAEDVKAVFGSKLTTVGSNMRKTLYETLAALEVDDGINLFGALNAALDVGGATDEKAFKSGPDQVILEEARRIKADAVVMGSHGHTSVGELLLGSTAHRVDAPFPWCSRTLSRAGGTRHRSEG